MSDMMDIKTAQARVAQLEAENAALRRALEPFARDVHISGKGYFNFAVTVQGPKGEHLLALLASDFDAARAALATS